MKMQQHYLDIKYRPNILKLTLTKLMHEVENVLLNPAVRRKLILGKLVDVTTV